MKRINDAVLRPGDIILTTSAVKVSKGIRFATGSDISHATVCVEGSRLSTRLLRACRPGIRRGFSTKIRIPSIFSDCAVVSPKSNSMRFSCLCAGTSVPNIQ